jgi:hypothetical protein
VAYLFSSVCVWFFSFCLREVKCKNSLAIAVISYYKGYPLKNVKPFLLHERYPQLYSRISFAHEFQKLSKDEMHHILEYKWDELGISIKKENFSDYEALTSIMKVTNGNFRLIHRLFTQMERILEINHLTSITTEVVEAARNSLVIGRK